MEAYHFVFDDDNKAKTFVERVAHYCKDVALFRDGPEVIVLDGHKERDQREEIRRLARSSSATRGYSLTVSFASPDETSENGNQ